MAQKLIRFAVSTAVIVSLLVPFAARAQEKKARSYPDIGIMNSIIKELMQVPYGRHDRIEVYGSYLPGFGLLFVVSPPQKFNFDFDFASFDSTMLEFSKQMKQFDSSMAKFHVMSPGNQAPRPRVLPFKEPLKPRVGKKAGGENDYSEGQYKAVLKFLESYADAENRLSPTQQIGVVVLSDGETAARFFRVSRKEVTDYRTGSADGGRFRQDVRVSSVEEKGEDNSISIMSTILDKSLGGSIPGDRHSVLLSGSQGVYLKGLGALFVCKPGNTFFGGKFEIPFKEKPVDVVQMERKVIRVLGDYGASLRFLPENEAIMVLLNIDSFSSENEHLLITLKKKDIDLYTRNEIDFNTLEQRAAVTENQ